MMIRHSPTLLFAFVLLSVHALPTCFDDGVCVELGDFQLPKPADADLFAQACQNFSGFRSGNAYVRQVFNDYKDKTVRLQARAKNSSSLFGAQRGNFLSNEALNASRFEIAALQMFSFGSFANGADAKLRALQGKNVPAAWRPAMEITASAFNRITALRKKALPPQRGEPPTIVFRGLNRPSGSLLATCNATTTPFRFAPGTTYTDFDFASTSLSVAEALDYAQGLSFNYKDALIVAIKLRSSHFVAPWNLQLEVDLLPGSSLQLISCGSMDWPVTRARGGERQYAGKTLPVLFAADPSFDPAAAEAELRKEMSIQAAACFPLRCQRFFGKCNPPPSTEPTEREPLNGPIRIPNNNCTADP